MKFDLISVVTPYPGGAAQEVERLVTNVIEQEIQELDGIKTVYSQSVEGLSALTVQLDPDATTSEKGQRDIKTVVDRLTSLPSDVKKPTVTSVETKYQPLIELYLSGIDDDLKLREVARLLEKKVEEIREVAKVSYRGWRKREIQVEASLGNLAQNHLSLEQLQQALASQNVSVPVGTIEADPASRRPELSVRTVGSLETVEDVKEMVVRANELGLPLRVKEVAAVREGLARPLVLNRVNGKPAIRMTVLQKETADAIRLVKNLRKVIADLKPSLPRELDITELNDSSSFITRRLDVLNGNLAIGLVLVLGILSLILPSRVAVLTALGIPFAFLGTMTLVYAGGISLNLISLIGLIIVCGMLVDDAIVVTDNAVRLMEEGVPPLEAAIRGTQQIWKSVFASVLTTIFAFIPLMTMSGIFGKFVKPI